ncbi:MULTISPECIES: hypothetical protein [Clostridium]|uniref:Uncharacterized protein n=1 Tax=Clostridium faecium TaxID=2762223 RepID=A0ABR8YWV9_9CLOT|nr:MULTISPECIES: hypothetical protein [Clostridium]MBD8048757.1 hypothetical protein [Clostridium faecium]MDU1348658.1 hypothetical protein [Clostridium argentinense]
MGYIKNLIFYLCIGYFIFLIDSNTVGNIWKQDKIILKRKNVKVTLKNIIGDILWIIICLAAGIIAIIYYPHDRSKLIFLVDILKTKLKKSYASEVFNF